VMRLGPLDPVSQENFMNLKIQDGGGRHLEKSNNSNISAIDGPISTKFGMVTYLSPP